MLLEVVSIFAAASFHFRRVSVPNGSYHNWSIRVIHRRYLACLPNCVSPSLVTVQKDHRLAFSLFVLRIMSSLHLSFLNNTEFCFLFTLLFFFPLSASVPDYSNLLSSSGKNNLTAVAQRQMSPQIRCHGSISAPVLASSRDFHTSYWCIQEMCVQMLLQNAGSHFHCLSFLQSFHKLLALLPCSACCCSLLLGRAAAFTACLPHLSRMFRHTLVIH